MNPILPPLSVAQIQAVAQINPMDYISEARLQELIELAGRNYCASAVLSAVREAVYAVRTGIVVPPTEVSA